MWLSTTFHLANSYLILQGLTPQTRSCQISINVLTNTMISWEHYLELGCLVFHNVWFICKTLGQNTILDTYLPRPNLCKTNTFEAYIHRRRQNASRSRPNLVYIQPHMTVIINSRQHFKNWRVNKKISYYRISDESWWC